MNHVHKWESREDGSYCAICNEPYSQKVEAPKRIRRPACEHVSKLTADGNGAFCEHCGVTLG